MVGWTTREWMDGSTGGSRVVSTTGLAADARRVETVGGWMDGWMDGRERRD